MASLLSRFTTFLPNTTVLSNHHNQELNRIVNLLNGTTTNLKTVLKTSDAGDPPLELDQLSTGPILKLFQGGILKASFGNTGALSIFDANPSIIFDDTAGTDSKIHHDASILRLGSTSVDHLSIDVSTGVATFAQIPVGPASSPTTDNQLARKKYVDDTRTAFSVTIGQESDPSTTTVAAEDRFTFFVPDGEAMTITKLKVQFKTGSHTTGGSLQYTVRVRNAAGGGLTDIGSINLDNTNNTINVVYTVDITDHVLTAGDSVTYFLAARSGTITERIVSVGFIGTQKRIP